MRKGYVGFVIEILHQTTTGTRRQSCRRRCILLKFYIKPQLNNKPIFYYLSCILLKFYIKPQLLFDAAFLFRCCILLKFYIKPQRLKLYKYIETVVSYWNSTSNHNLSLLVMSMTRVVSYWNSTSNHNISLRSLDNFLLYLIEILHQTTTAYWGSRSGYQVVSYWNSTSNHNLSGGRVQDLFVVSYWNSTSNHNGQHRRAPHHSVVSYWNSTSNHN